MPILNLTAHPIKIISNAIYSPTIRKHVVPDKVNVKVKMTIPSYATANGKFETINLQNFEGCPDVDKIVKGCDGLPKVADPENTIFIVSTSYARAYETMHPKDPMDNFYILGEKVYNATGKVTLGTLRIVKYRRS